MSQRRTQAERRSESEESLLDAAAASVAELGIERASLAAIGERAGRSRGLANHHFGSKDILIARLAARCQDRLTDASLLAIRSAQDEGRALDAPGAVSIMVDTYLAHFDDPGSDARALLVMWGASFPSVASRAGIDEANERAHAGLVDLLEQGRVSGSVRDDVDPRAAAAVVLGMLRGVAAQLMSHPRVDVDVVRAECSRWIDAALAGPTAELAARAGDRNSTAKTR